MVNDIKKAKVLYQTGRAAGGSPLFDARKKQIHCPSCKIRIMKSYIIQVKEGRTGSGSPFLA